MTQAPPQLVTTMNSTAYRPPAGIFNSIPYYGLLLVTGGLAVVGFLQFGTVGHLLGE